MKQKSSPIALRTNGGRRPQQDDGRQRRQAKHSQAAAAQKAMHSRQDITLRRQSRAANAGAKATVDQMVRLAATLTAAAAAVRILHLSGGAGTAAIGTAAMTAGNWKMTRAPRTAAGMTTLPAGGKAGSRMGKSSAAATTVTSARRAAAAAAPSAADSRRQRGAMSRRGGGHRRQTGGTLRGRGDRPAEAATGTGGQQLAMMIGIGETDGTSSQTGGPTETRAHRVTDTAADAPPAAAAAAAASQLGARAGTRLLSGIALPIATTGGQSRGGPAATERRRQSLRRRSQSGRR